MGMSRLSEGRAKLALAMPSVSDIDAKRQQGTITLNSKL